LNEGRFLAALDATSFRRRSGLPREPERAAVVATIV